MTITELSIGGAWKIDITRYPDNRGWFQEWFKKSELQAHINFDFSAVQANISKSAAGVIRGIHYSIAPQGQAKLVTVMSGAIDDYVVDINPKSPTFGGWERVHISADQGTAVLLSPHMGHAFQALTADTVVSYIVTAEFNPGMEKGITPMCPYVAIEWTAKPAAIISAKDLQAPQLITQRDSGNLPLT